MANPKKRVPENAPGDFFVDSTCIDCDACRQIAPAVFGEAAETSFVKAQPLSGADRRQALQALLACPTGSIGCLGDDDPKAVMQDFPLAVEGPVSSCGFNSPANSCSTCFIGTRASLLTGIRSLRACFGLVARALHR